MSGYPLNEPSQAKRAAICARKLRRRRPRQTADEVIADALNRADNFLAATSQMEEFPDYLRRDARLLRRRVAKALKIADERV